MCLAWTNSGSKPSTCSTTLEDVVTVSFVTSFTPFLHATSVTPLFATLLFFLLLATLTASIISLSATFVAAAFSFLLSLPWASSIWTLSVSLQSTSSANLAVAASTAIFGWCICPCKTIIARAITVNTLSNNPWMGTLSSDVFSFSPTATVSSPRSTTVQVTLSGRGGLSNCWNASMSSQSEEIVITSPSSSM